MAISANSSDWADHTKYTTSARVGTSSKNTVPTLIRYAQKKCDVNSASDVFSMMTG